MSSCMHCCWLSTRVLYSATSRATYPGPHTTVPRDGVARWFCSLATPSLSRHTRSNVDTHNNVQRGTETETRNSVETPTHTKPQTHTVAEIQSHTSTQTQVDTLAQRLNVCHLSEIHNHLHKQAVPELSHICWISQNTQPNGLQSCDDVRQSVLTNKHFIQPAEMTSKRSEDCLTPQRGSAKKKKKEQLVLNSEEFIPLFSSPPQEEESEDLFGGNFFILDTSPSEVVFDEPTKGKVENFDCASNKPSRKNADKSSGTCETLSVKKLSDNAVSSSSDAKNGCTSKAEQGADSDIEFVEAKFVKSRTPLKNNHKNENKRTSNKCRSPKCKSSTSVEDDDEIGIVYETPRTPQQDEVTVVCTVNSSSSKEWQDGKMSSFTSSTSPVSLASTSTSQNTQARLCHTYTSHGLKTKPSEENELHESRGLRESSPGIKKVNVVDPDVVEIEDQPTCSTDALGVEVIGIFNNDDSDDDSGDENTKKVDVSNDTYVSLEKVKVQELQNTKIDVSDETLDLRRRLEGLRRWDMTGLGQDIISGRNIKPTDVTFTVMSYNVLAQALLTDNEYLYNSCEAEHLTWEYRWALLQHEVEGVDPDILLLQEVQASHYHSHYLPWFTFKGYEGLYKKRTGHKSDGCAIFFKHSKFSLVEHCSVEYLQPEAEHVLDRDNIALIAKLSSAAEPNAPHLCVATTHLLYNPRRHDVKLAQTVLLLSEIDRLCYEGEEGGRTKYCPVLVSGDFNAEPHSTLIEFLKCGRLQYEGLSSKTLSRHGSFSSQLDSCLIPPGLGLTERCQHAVLAQSRFTERLHGPLFQLSDKRRLEESLIKIRHSDRERPATSSCEKNKSDGRGPSQSGWFSHGFNFKSVYNHRVGNHAPEVTTRQGAWTTVDYIFYSRVYSRSKGQPVEGKLKLLARHRLLSGPEADRFGPLPSAVCPSDHFPLAAQFLLRR